MNTNYQSLLKIFEEYLQQQNFAGSPKELYQPIEYAMSSGGKRMRPVLCLMGCAIFGGKVQDALPVALAMEIFHNFTLVHDDIMDEADLRRGYETVVKKFGRDSAILSGDTMMILAYEYLLKAPDKHRLQILSDFTHMSKVLCEGQQLDMNFELQDEVKQADYFEMIYGKTAILLQCCLTAGARIGGATSDQILLLEQFSKSIGLAFQLKDDWLDVFGDESRVGKKIAGDVIQCKKSMPYIILKSVLSTPEWAKFKQLYSNIDMEESQRVSEVLEVFHKHDVSQKLIEFCQVQFDQAIDCLSQLKSENINTQNIEDFAQKVVGRLN